MIGSVLYLNRIIMALVLAAIVAGCVIYLDWTWLPKYWPLLVEGLWRTIWLLLLSSAIGFILALGLGWAQAYGPTFLASPARVFCTVIRGTPLLVQLWFIYYGFGTLLSQMPEIRQSDLWPILRQAWPYALLALTLSFAGYEGEVMRGAFASVPKGQTEAARSMGMPGFTLFRRIHLPLAIQGVLPTLAGETILQLKATPLVATVTMVELYAVASRVRQETLIVYEPLLLLAVIYLGLAGVIVTLFAWLERRSPLRRT
ncbi:MAG: ABC transporter permease subunit [Hyphomicrobiales bacterium]|nr:ABC transporter permease subunit [Hyphomicrobiales bacterium]